MPVDRIILPNKPPEEPPNKNLSEGYEPGYESAYGNKPDDGGDEEWPPLPPTQDSPKGLQ